MKNRTAAVCLTLVCIFCFYQPWIYIRGPFYQTGEHFGGLAYGLLWLPIGFGVAFWLGQRSLALIASSASVLLALLMVLIVGFSNAAWALWGSLLFCSVSAAMAFLGQQSKVVVSQISSSAG